MCGVRPAVHRHHALYRRDKRYPELNTEENVQIVCETCHLYEGTPDNHDNKVAFWHKQCERYGRQHMIAWHNELPLRVKEYAYR